MRMLFCAMFNYFYIRLNTKALIPHFHSTHHLHTHLAADNAALRAPFHLPRFTRSHEILSLLTSPAFRIGDF